MDIKSRFADHYKTDLSIENLRAKVARRKSVSQKENRHNEFKKSRGLALVDLNVSTVKEQDPTGLEEVNEMFQAKEPIINNAPGKLKDNLSAGRRAMLQRFVEEKKLRKIKEQREKASKGIFKCGIYRPDNPLIPVFTSHNATKVKPKEKAAPPAVTRVTRSAAKIEASAPNTRSRPPQQVPVLSKVPERTVPKGRGQSSVLKSNEKENKAIPSTRTTKATVATSAISKFPAVKGAVKNASVPKPQKRTQEKSEQKVTLAIQEPLVQQKTKEITEKVKPEVTTEVTDVESEIPAKTSFREERKPSFAPENFVFQPLDGLSAFKFQPMTPKRANAFLTPTFTWSPVDGKRDFVFTREHVEENVSTLDLAIKTSVELETGPGNQGVGAALPVRDKIPPICVQNGCTPSVNVTQADEAPHDVPYFRNLLKSESQKLTLLCSQWDKRFDEDIPEDAKDIIRTTVGQTRLLMTERFKQFEGLVDNCEFKLGEKETTCTDLDGFWDMIYFQIEDVCKKFVNLEKLEGNLWQQTTVQAKKVVKKKIVPAAIVHKSQDDNGRAAARSRLASIKAAMKKKVKQEEMIEEAAVSEQAIQVNPVVFDAGFFRIESPAKLHGSLKSTRTSSQSSDTPKSAKRVLQNSNNQVTDHTEVADHTLVQKSPSPVKSPVRKALFDTEEESFQNHEQDLVVTNRENIESETVPQVDLTKYLVPTAAITESVMDSPGSMECSRSLTVGTELVEDSTFEITGTIVDNVFSSPEKFPETKTPPPKDGEIEILPDLKNCDDPLDFLGSCTSNLVSHTPLKSGCNPVVSDLMVFSPTES